MLASKTNAISPLFFVCCVSHGSTAMINVEDGENPNYKPEHPGAPASLLAKVRANLSFQSKWSELNGAMGDLGTYIPIILALSLANGLDLGATLIFTGVYNILTGALYGVPMPVQPMKSIAAVAISSGPDFAVPEIMAAGICTSAVVFFLGATRLMQLAYKLIPLPVVRGIQLSQGLSFATTAVKYIRHDQDLAKGKSLGQRSWLGLDGLLLAIAVTFFIVVVNGAGEEVEDDNELALALVGSGEEQRRRRRRRWRKLLAWVPSAVIVFLLGIILAIIRKPSAVEELKPGPSAMHVVKISKHAWKEGFIKGAVPQIPLTVLNSVVAVCKLSTDLFPDKPEATATSVSVTVGLMNLIGCWFGAMPCCHGAGGLAGQYKFGGRSGGCVAALGAAKLVIGVVLGGSILRVLVEFPVGLLGVLLLFAGVELAMAARDMASKKDAFVMLLCAAVSLGASSAALGFACGIVVHLILVLRRWLMK
ncbi:molybdate transporter 1-like [Phoenix dactylifera]|uniref:Molybdate transporter 1-like n=1 Tax=Phoenix dactylifera TaxID=42345 RepID=A0A8B7D0I4_PHODC|nr:molybdate transporter 1-like [Phoenix dactylifera]